MECQTLNGHGLPRWAVTSLQHPENLYGGIEFIPLRVLYPRTVLATIKSTSEQSMLSLVVKSINLYMPRQAPWLTRLHHPRALPSLTLSRQHRKVGSRNRMNSAANQCTLSDKVTTPRTGAIYCPPSSTVA